MTKYTLTATLLVTETIIEGPFQTMVPIATGITGGMLGSFLAKSMASGLNWKNKNFNRISSAYRDEILTDINNNSATKKIFYKTHHLFILIFFYLQEIEYLLDLITFD